MLKQGILLRSVKVAYLLVAVLVVFLSLDAQASVTTSSLECARKDTFQFLPLSGPEDIKSFVDLIAPAGLVNIGPNLETLEKALKAAQDNALKKEEIEIAHHMLLTYANEDIDAKKLISTANLVRLNLDYLPRIKRSDAMNLVANAVAGGGDQYSALNYYHEALELADSTRPLDRVYPLGNLSALYLASNDTAAALKIVHQLIDVTSNLKSEIEVAYNHVYNYVLLAEVHLAQDHVDSSTYYINLASKHYNFFKPENPRHTEMTAIFLQATIPLNIKKSNHKATEEQIEKLSKDLPRLATYFRAEYLYSLGALNKALVHTDANFEYDPEYEKRRLELRRKIAKELGNFKIAEQASSNLLAIERNILADSKKALITISKGQLEAFEKVRQADIIQYEQQLEILRTRQRTWIATLLILLSLGVAIWFYHRYKKSILKSKSLSKILSQHEQDLILANKALATKVKSMEQFNHLLSHDLREPLRSISGFTTLLRKKVQKYEELSTDFSLLSNSVDQLTHLIAGVEILRAVEERKVDSSQTSISKTINNIEQNLKKKYPDHRIEISVKGYLGRFIIDEQLLFTSLREVMDNAAKFCENKSTFITVEVLHDEDELSIYVQDEGIGMNTDFKEQIFGLFKRLNRRENFSGAGVGLTLSKLAAEKCMGSIMVLESHLGQGSTFKLTFPFGGATQEKATLEEPVLQTW